MADITFTLTKEDADILRRLVEREKGRLENTLNRPHIPFPLPASPEVLIALAPAGGIPALGNEAVPEANFTGTGSGIGNLSEPSGVDCACYRIILDSFGVAQLDPLWITQTIYNLSSTAIAEDTWVIAVQDRFGSWLVAAATGSAPLEVRGADGTPAYQLTSALEFDEADGFVITRPSAGVVRIDLPAGETSTVREIWCNCTVTASLLTLEDDEHVLTVVRLSAGLYKVLFDIDFLDEEHFEWSGNCKSSAYLYETARTSSSVTVQTSSLADVARWGIDVRGHIGEAGTAEQGTAEQGTGTGTGAGQGAYGAGGSSTCAAAAAGTVYGLGVAYGPYTASLAEQWFRFPIAMGTGYHITITWINGTTPGGVGAVGLEGNCDAISPWITTSEANAGNPVACGQSVTPAAANGFMLVKVSTAFTESYTITVGAGPC